MTESEQRVQYYKDMYVVMGELDYEMLKELSVLLGISKYIPPNLSPANLVHEISNRCLANNIKLSEVKDFADHIYARDSKVKDPMIERLAWLDARINDQRNEIAKNILACEHPNLVNLINAKAVELQGRGLLLNSYLQEKAILLGVKNV